MELELPILTEKNYYDDVFYMSNSRFKEYIACPLRQQAIDLGFWRDKNLRTLFYWETMFTLTLRVRKLMPNS